MRKTIIVLVIIALVISAGAYYYFYKPLARQTAIEAVLPKDTLGMIRVCELKKQIERFRKGRMGQSLGGIDLPQLMAAMEIPPKQRTEITHAVGNFKTAVNSTWFDAFFGQDVSFAMLNINLDPRQLESVDPETLLDSIVLVARPKQSVKIIESFASMFGSTLSVKTQKYQQWEISEFFLKNGRPVYYALTKGLMIAGFSIAPVKRCLKQSLDDSTSLLQAEIYQRHCADLYKSGQTDFLAFANADHFITFFREAVSHKADTDPGARKLVTQFENLQGIETINFVQYDDGSPLVRSKIIAGIDRTKLSHRLKTITDIDPAANHILKYIPVDSLIYNWQNTFDLKVYWDEIQHHPEITSEAVAKIKQSFVKETGMEIESLLDAFGTQAGMLIKDINMDGPFPYPELALFIEVKQPDVINQLIKQQIKKLNMPIQHETYRKTDVKYVMLPTGANMSPAYTFIEEYFALTINRNLLKSMIDAPDKKSLGSNSNFKALGKEMTAENNQIFYLNTEEMIIKTRKLISWGISWMAIAQRDKVEKASKIVNLGINPLLDGLSMIKAMGGSTYIGEDFIKSDMQVLMDR
ncbi:MAG: DUF3352 domain-containing protein [Proteobacteria bacterium]|nr:DUF3352 domain-containing protein [Pseudomonadota bacterium]